MSLPEPSPVRHEAPRGGRPDWLAIVLALLIGTASVLSAVVAWRASAAAIEGSRLNSLVVQQQARRQQLERELEGIVAQDQRLAAAVLEHSRAAVELERQADELRLTDGAAADELDVLAHGERALVRVMQPLFVGSAGVTINDDGTVAYDPTFVLDYLREADPELRQLDPQATLVQANRADEHTISLIAIAAVLVAALLFLTIAQVANRRQRLRSAFAVAGAVLISGALVALVLSETLPR